MRRSGSYGLLVVEIAHALAKAVEGHVICENHGGNEYDHDTLSRS